MLFTFFTISIATLSLDNLTTTMFFFLIQLCWDLWVQPHLIKTQEASKPYISDTRIREEELENEIMHKTKRNQRYPERSGKLQS